jgi:RimJ/RimL family protein N-acetyltransferase
MPLHPDVLLQTARLRLRRFRPADADSLVALDSDPEVMRYVSDGRPTPRNEIEHDVLPDWLASYQPSTCMGFWAAELIDTDAFAGWFHMRPDHSEPDILELGYRLQRRVWGQGLATEGARALIDAVFATELARSVCARALIGNMASRRVMEKCGLEFDGEFEYPADMAPGVADRRAVKYVIVGRNSSPRLNRRQARGQGTARR